MTMKTPENLPLVQQSLDESIFPASTSTSGSARNASRKSRTTSPKPGPRKATTAKSTQAYLPGLSRRGRPRLENPISASERAAENRKKRLASGAKRIELILDADAASDIDVLTRHLKLPRNEIIIRLIMKAARKIRRVTQE
jgi:hypothetical protein